MQQERVSGNDADLPSRLAHKFFQKLIDAAVFRKNAISMLPINWFQPPESSSCRASKQQGEFAHLFEKLGGLRLRSKVRPDLKLRRRWHKASVTIFNECSNHLLDQESLKFARKILKLELCCFAKSNCGDLFTIDSVGRIYFYSVDDDGPELGYLANSLCDAIYIYFMHLREVDYRMHEWCDWKEIVRNDEDFFGTWFTLLPSSDNRFINCYREEVLVATIPMWSWPKSDG